MLTNLKDELHQIYIVRDTYSNYQDIELLDDGLVRFDFGLPKIEDKLLYTENLINFLRGYSEDFIKENVFDDKYLAYKRWQEILNKRVEEINKLLGELK